MWWLFVFYEGRLIGTEGGIVEYSTGDYIDVPLDTLSPTRNIEYWWTGRGG
jgi:hypothetical protein